MNSLGTASLDQLKRAVALREQIESLQAELNQLLVGKTIVSPKQGGMSASGRARVAAAQRLRWAKIKGTCRPSGKRKMSAAARAKIAAAARARWAKIKAAGKSRL